MDFQRTDDQIVEELNKIEKGLEDINQQLRKLCSAIKETQHKRTLNTGNSQQTKVSSISTN